MLSGGRRNRIKLGRRTPVAVEPLEDRLAPASVIQLERATYSTSETGAPLLTINVMRSGGAGAVGVSYSVEGGTAERNTDKP